MFKINFEKKTIFVCNSTSVCNISGTCKLPFVEITYVNLFGCVGRGFYSYHDWGQWVIPIRRRIKSEQSLTFYPVETDMRKC